MFFIFLLYLVFLYLRPVELFAQWMIPYRPMMVVWLISFSASLIHVLRFKDAAATATHYVLLFMLMLAVAFSLFVKGRLGDGAAAIADFSASVLLFYLISFNLRSLKRLRAACFVILFCLFTLAATGIYAYHTGFMSEELVLQQRKDDDSIDAPKERPPIPAQDQSGAFMWRVRGVGFFNDPNDFAQTLVMSLPMLWWFYRKGAWIRNAFLVGLPGAVIGYCITLTNSRGALLGIASLMFFGIRNALGTFKTVMLLGVGGVGAMVIGATGGRGFSSKEESAEGRIDAWYEGFQMLKSSPIFGIGYGEFTEHHYLTAHNSFVLCFAEIGLVGYFIWISLLVLGYIAVGRVAQYAPLGSEERLAGSILRASLVGYLTCAWFLSRTYQPVLYGLLALCTAVWMCARKMPACQNIPEIQAPLNWFKPAVMVMFLSMAAVYGFIFMHNLGG
ncbi:MAG: O-antigen ligase family protein [Acidobacteriota bacterium]